MKKLLIVFGGPDGAGKTTLSILLSIYFRRKKMKVKIVRIRGTHTFAYIFMTFLKKVTSSAGDDLHYYRFRIPEKARSLWVLIELVSIIPLIFLHYYVYRVIYDVVISERGPLDFAVWVLTGVKPKTARLSTKIFLVLVQTFILYFKTIYIVANKEKLLKRKQEETTLITAMYSLYNLLASLLSLPRIDTTHLHPLQALNRVLETLRS